MIKKSLLPIMFYWLCNSLFAQNRVFNEGFRVIPGLPANSFSVQNAPGGFIIYAETADSANHFDPSISKIDSVGSILWQKSYHKIDYNFVPFDLANELGVVVPWGGGVGLVNWEKDTSTPFLLMNSSLYRFDGNGDTLWTKNYTDSASVEYGQLKITRDKKYSIYGQWYDFINDSHILMTLFLRKTDTLGNRIWTRTYHAPVYHERYPSGMDTCLDGGYVLCAYDWDTDYNYSRIGCDSGRIMVMKTDSAGMPQWVTYIQDTICDVWAGSVKALRHGGYVVCGFWDDSLNWNGEVPYSIMYMAKLDDSGNIVWHRTYGLHWSEEGSSTLYTVNEVPNGDLIVCGNAPVVDTLFYFGAILRTDSNGNQKWLNYYQKFNPPDEDYLTDIQLTSDGGFISSGYTYSNPEEIWVVKTDSLGCDSGCGEVATQIAEIRDKRGEISVFPNPSTGKFNVVCHSERSEESPPIIDVYNVLGEKVLTETLRFSQGDNLIDLREQPDGVYLYRVLKDTGELVGEGKVVIEK